MNLAVIKQILSLAGINNLVIRFDDAERQIIATYVKDSQGHTSFIKFTDIEKLFTQGPTQAHSSPPVDEPTPAAD